MIVDRTGHVSAPVVGGRIVSLVPSMTETLYALGLGDLVVGATTYCLFPEGPLRDVPRVGGTKTPRIATIRDLKPDLVHMNMEENLLDHAEQIRAFSRVFVTEPATVSDVDSLFSTLGDLHECRSEAAALSRRLAEVVGSLRLRDFRFAVPIWKQPWMWAGGDTYVSHLVETMGGTNVLAEMHRYPQVSLEDVIARRPDMILLPDEPWKFTDEDRGMLETRGATALGPFPGHFVTWHGVRTIYGLEFLDGLLP